MQHSLKWRLSLLITLLFLVANLLTFVMIRHSTQMRYSRYMAEGDQVQARILAQYLAANWEDFSQGNLNVPLSIMGPPRGMPHMEGRRPMMRGAQRPLVITDDRGRILFSNQENPDSLGDFTGGAPIIVQGETRGYIMVGALKGGHLTEEDRIFLAGLNRIYLFSTLLFSLLGLAVAFLLIQMLFRPLEKIHRTIDLLAKGQSQARSGLKGSDEVSRLGKRLDQMAQAMEEGQRWKEQIIADTAHELRTPVSLIQGNLEMIQEGIYPADKAKLEQLYGQTRDLARLIEDMQYLSSLEGEHYRLDNQSFDVAEWLLNMGSQFRPLMEEKGLKLKLVQGKKCSIQGDRSRLNQVMTNLLANAAAYSPRGGTVRVEWNCSDGQIRIAVDDEGPGIPQGKRQAVFERFYRLDTPRSNAKEGRGLGLAISKAIVESHGGEIAAEQSSIGGARLWFSLPLL